MYTVMVTGGIGSGKSALVDEFRALGADSIDLDEVNRGLLATNDQLKHELAERFGEDILDRNKDIDRLYLARLVFSDALLRNRLNGIIHPYVYKRVQNKIQLEEERRLAYVAFTRAENVLCLSDAEDGVAGESGTRYPSRFLLEMDMGGLNIARGISEDFLEAAKAYIANIDRDREFLSDESLGLVKKAPSAEFAVGDRVVHKIFGAGIVKAVDEKNFCYEIDFEKFATPRSIQFDFPLTKIP